MLEALANELLLELFGYFRTSHLLRAFRSLNSRFEQLLVVHLRNCHYLDLRSISKIDCNFLCEHHLHSLSTQINSLTLSNDDESPQQIQLLLSHGFTLRQFTHLRSLSVYHSLLPSMTNEILKQCLELPHLTHLRFTECEFQGIDPIWRLTKLSHLTIDNPEYNGYFSVVSTSPCLQVLVLHRSTMYSLINLLQHTPNLRCLDTHGWDADILIDLDPNQSFPSIVTLKLAEAYQCIFTGLRILESMESFFHVMPNVRSLTVETSSAIINGNDWEQLITTYLPKLENFRLKMQMDCFDAVRKGDKVDELFRSFQSHFWIVARQWYIGCHYDLRNTSPCRLLFYTLPYTFPNLFVSNGYQWYKSTYPYEDDPRPYDRVRALEYASSSREVESGDGQPKVRQSALGTKLQELFPFRSGRSKLSSRLDDLISSDECSTPIVRLVSHFPKPPSILYVPHLRRLTIRLPHVDYFKTMTSSLDHLHSLDVFLTSQCNDASQLQALLDRAPRLYAFTFGRSSTLMKEISVSHLRSASVRMLNLRRSDSFGIYASRYDRAQCTQLARSQLGQQCEVLIIDVKHRASILYLVKTMGNLRALTVQSRGDLHLSQRTQQRDCIAFRDHPFIRTPMLDREEFIRWLQQSLQSTMLLERNMSSESNIRVWIR